MRKLRILLLLGTVLLEAGCGLPDTYFLQPPVVVTQVNTTTNYFSFNNPIHDLNHDINVNFKGDELYYKLYGDTAIDVNAVDPASPTDPSVQLANKGFYPITLATDSVGTRIDPVIAINSALAAAGSSVTVTINSDITFGGNSNFVLATNPAAEIRRGVVDLYTGNTYKVFQQNPLTLPADKSYQSTDADFAAAYATLQANGLNVMYVAWYVMSFGYTTSGTPVRSTAAYLGYMSMPYQ